MGFQFAFLGRFLAFSLLFGAVIGYSHTYHSINTIDNASTNKSKVLYYSNSEKYSVDGTVSRHERTARSIENGRTPSVCNTVNYYWNSQSGRQSTCPFEWVVNNESRRIPERFIEQVCLSCGTCGQNHQCTQLKVHYQVYFRDTAEFSRQVVRAGCVCMPADDGLVAHALDTWNK